MTGDRRAHAAGAITARRVCRAIAARLVTALLTAVVAAGCGMVSRPQSQATASEGTLRYTVGRLSFDAPAAWQATGDARHVVLVGPANEGRIEARQVDRKFPDDAQCLGDAETALQRGGARLTGVRRHASTIAGRKALFQEADQDRWHGWAWAVCDRGEQYRVFLTALAPVREPAVRAMRLLSSSATLSGR